MGIGSNLMVEIAEQEHREKLFELIVTRAAELVVNEKKSRNTAIDQAESQLADEMEAIKNGMPDDESSFKDLSECNDEQVIAVAKSLHEDFQDRFL